jgi:hypothetical protein
MPWGYLIEVFWFRCSANTYQSLRRIRRVFKPMMIYCLIFRIALVDPHADEAQAVLVGRIG